MTTTCEKKPQFFIDYKQGAAGDKDKCSLLHTKAHPHQYNMKAMPVLAQNLIVCVYKYNPKNKDILEWDYWHFVS